ncbi:hypothetical protein DL93DRAFT_2234398 [Clavulina sp. PMI_390]|nr:hypothetical protein DL93DRAFT_2234398 [Clavulina sp. PMI_390]
MKYPSTKKEKFVGLLETAAQSTHSGKSKAYQCTPEGTTGRSSLPATAVPRQRSPPPEYPHLAPHPTVPPIEVTAPSPSPIQDPLTPKQHSTPTFYATLSQPSTPASTLSWQSTAPTVSPAGSWDSSTAADSLCPPSPHIPPDTEPFQTVGLGLIMGPDTDGTAGSSHDRGTMLNWDQSWPVMHVDVANTAAVPSVSPPRPSDTLAPFAQLQDISSTDEDSLLHDIMAQANSQGSQELFDEVWETLLHSSLGRRFPSA